MPKGECHLLWPQLTFATFFAVVGISGGAGAAGDTAIDICAFAFDVAAAVVHQAFVDICTWCVWI